MNKATEKQINYIKILIEQTGADTPDFSDMSKADASSMISELKARKDNQKAVKVIGEAKVEGQKVLMEEMNKAYRPLNHKSSGGIKGLFYMGRKISMNTTGSFANGGALFANYAA